MLIDARLLQLHKLCNKVLKKYNTYKHRRIFYNHIDRLIKQAASSGKQYIDIYLQYYCHWYFPLCGFIIEKETFDTKITTRLKLAGYKVEWIEAEGNRLIYRISW